MPLNKFGLKNVTSNTPSVRKVQIIHYLWGKTNSVVYTDKDVLYGYIVLILTKRDKLIT